MRGIPSAATPEFLMLRENNFAATHSRPVRTRNAESLMPPDPIPRTMCGIPSAATPEFLMPRENKFAATTNSRLVRTMNAESLMPPDPAVNPRPTQTNDTRRFEVPRLSNLNGYEALPNVLSGMGFRLPYFGDYSGQLVRLRGQMWELWSPNSLRLPYYPGVPEVNHCPKMAILPQNRRCDGHLGRFNYTVSPQVGGMPWWPLVRHCLPDYTTTNQFPEFDFVHTRWINDPAPAFNSGQLEPSFIEDLIQRNEWLDKEMQNGQVMEAMQPDVWGYCPARIANHEFNRLRGSLHYERVVDDVTDLQRVLKGKAAWIEWAKQYMLDHSWTETAVLGRDVPKADDSFVGMWINDLTRHQALWLIKEKIPCFIIHSYTPADLDRCRLHDLPSIPSFIQWSEAELLKPENNGYAFIALKHGQIRSEILSDHHVSRVATNRNLVELERGLSMS
jgi:hypothetical protein